MGSSDYLSIDLGLRGAVVGISLLIACVLLRDRRDRTVACLGAALLVSAAASAICSAPNFPWPWQWWSLVLLALSCSGTVVFWLWVQTTFDDDFVLRPWHGALLAAIVGIQLFTAAGIARPHALELALERALSVTYLGLALLAAAQTVLTWRADLVAGRRRLRLVVLMGAAAYIGISAFLNLSPTASAPSSISGSSVASVAGAFGLCALLGLSGWTLLRAVETRDGPLPSRTTADVLSDDRPVASEDKLPATGLALLRRLQHLMLVERAYRREGLTIGSLSAELGVPEYRLRQLINESLGHRNFNAFLNRYRIEEAKLALADPGQNEVPVLTIAMDTGFQSVGPFNRAFKAATDLTPTEFRRRSVTEHDSSGIGQPD